MRTITDTNGALLEALTMLQTIERGGSYATFDWYERMLKIAKFLPDNLSADLEHHTMFDLEQSKARISRK